ncbi:MAG: hypothetical protein ACTSSP_09665 [Candidatus Asgardarchaeia archaeon]
MKIVLMITLPGDFAFSTPEVLGFKNLLKISLKISAAKISSATKYSPRQISYQLLP